MFNKKIIKIFIRKYFEINALLYIYWINIFVSDNLFKIFLSIFLNVRS